MFTTRRLALTSLVTSLAIAVSLPAIGGIDATSPSSGTVTDTGLGLRDRRGWGLLATTNKPYYQVGQTLTGRSIIFTSTNDDAYDIIPSKGGLGCDYDWRIRNALGEIVWQPGQIRNGQFDARGCLFGSITKHVPPGGSYRDTARIPLIYQNAGGVGTMGDPLPQGFYQLELNVYFGGPFRSPPLVHVPTGTFYAQVPFQIE